jgi:hypothetical protein
MLTDATYVVRFRNFDIHEQKTQQWYVQRRYLVLETYDREIQVLKEAHRRVNRDIAQLSL